MELSTCGIYKFVELFSTTFLKNLVELQNIPLLLAQLRKKLLEQLLVITLTSPVSLWVLWIGMSRLRLLSYHG